MNAIAKLTFLLFTITIAPALAEETLSVEAVVVDVIATESEVKALEENASTVEVEIVEIPEVKKDTVECDKAVEAFEAQAHIKRQSEKTIETAEADMNNPNPLYFFSRGANARSIKANRLQLEEATKKMDEALNQIKENCDARVDQYIEEVKTSINEYFSSPTTTAQSN